MATLEQRGTTWVVVDDAGCRPATPVEIDLWREIDAARAALRAIIADVDAGRSANVWLARRLLREEKDG